MQRGGDQHLVTESKSEPRYAATRRTTGAGDMKNRYRSEKRRGFRSC